MDNGNLIITKSRDTFNPSKDDDDFNISVNIKNNAAGDKYRFVVKNGSSKGEITSLPQNLGTTTLKNLLMKLLLKMTLRLAIQKLLVRILQLAI